MQAAEQELVCLALVSRWQLAFTPRARSVCGAVVPDAEAPAPPVSPGEVALVRLVLARFAAPAQLWAVHADIMAAVVRACVRSIYGRGERR
jgi:hypothetical protein